MKIQGILFSVILILFMCGPLALYVSERAGLEVPIELTTKPAQYLSGDETETEIAPVATVDGFTSKALQSAMEAKLGENIPAKAVAIIDNAAAQRMMIAASNAIFQWDCYPTYYGSARLYLDCDALTYMPKPMDEATIDAWREFGKGVASVAQRNPEKRFVVYVVGGYDDPAYNPAYELVSSCLRPQDCLSALEETIGSTANVQILTQPYDSAESYYHDFFRTDHHWNIDGAFVAYGQIADALQLQTVSEEDTAFIPDYEFSGATARWGLDLLQEQVFDCKNDFANLTATKQNGTSLSGDNHDSFWDASPLRKPYMFYDAYYNNLGNCVITGGSGERSALLVSNSYRGAIQRPLAESYRQLAVNAQLHPDSELVETLDQQISAVDADDIIILGNPGNLDIDAKYWQ